MKQIRLALLLTLTCSNLAMDLQPEMKLVGLIKNAHKNIAILDRAKDLIKQYRFDVNFKFKENNETLTSLTSWAFKHKRLDIVRVLIDHGAELYPIHDTPPLIRACKIYIDHCSSSKPSDHTLNKKEPLETYMKDALELSVILLEKKDAATAINKTYKFGSNWQLPSSLLYEATRAESYEMCKLLLEHGADVNHFNSELETATSSACINKWNEGLKLFLRHGVNINFRYRGQHTLLMGAAGCATRDQIDIIIKHILHSRKAAKTFMLCLYRKNKDEPDACLKLLFTQGKTLLQRHILKASVEYNKANLLDQLKLRNTSGYTAFSIREEVTPCLNPDNIDETVKQYLHKDFGGTCE